MDDCTRRRALRVCAGGHSLRSDGIILLPRGLVLKCGRGCCGDHGALIGGPTRHGPNMDANLNQNVKFGDKAVAFQHNDALTTGTGEATRRVPRLPARVKRCPRQQPRRTNGEDVAGTTARHYTDAHGHCVPSCGRPLCGPLRGCREEGRSAPRTATRLRVERTHGMSDAPVIRHPCARQGGLPLSLRPVQPLTSETRRREPDHTTRGHED